MNLSEAIGGKAKENAKTMRSVQLCSLILGIVLVLNTGAVMGMIGGNEALSPFFSESGLWHFDEGEGFSAGDSSGNGNNGTIQGAAWTMGRFGYGLGFGSPGSLVRVPDDDMLDLTGDFTMCAWICPQSMAYIGAVICKLNATVNMPGSWELLLDSGIPHLNYYTDSWHSIEASARASAYSWNCLILVYNASAKTYAFYLNGLESGSGTQDLGITDTGCDIVIGAKSPESHLFEGTIDEVSVCSRALTEAEIYAKSDDRLYSGEIRIDSDMGFVASNGVGRGNGTASNPYVIEGYDIDGSGLGSCIYIGNTTKQFVIRGCHLHGAGSFGMWPYRPNAGMVLYNVSGGCVDSNSVYSNSAYGVLLIGSNDCRVMGNSVTGNGGTGIALSGSDSNEVFNNTLSYNGKGAEITAGANNSIFMNDFQSNAYQASDDTGLNMWNAPPSLNFTVEGEDATCTAGESDWSEQFPGEEVWQDEIWPAYSLSDTLTMFAEAGYSFYIDAYKLAELDLHISGSEDAPDLDMAIFLDGYSSEPLDGEVQINEIVDREVCDFGAYESDWGYTDLALSTDPHAIEGLRLFSPPDGRYIVKVLGYDVVGSPGHFNLTITRTTLTKVSLANGLIIPGSENLSLTETKQVSSYHRSQADNNAIYVMDGTEMPPWSVSLPSLPNTGSVTVSLYDDACTPNNPSDDWWGSMESVDFVLGVHYFIDYATGEITFQLDLCGWMGGFVHANYSVTQMSDIDAAEYVLFPVNGTIAFCSPLPAVNFTLCADYTYTVAAGGNRWSDYSGIDVLSGENQTLPGPDGFGDLPYPVGELAADHYPRMVLLRAGLAAEPIRIDRNSDFTPSHGVTGGSGTAADPWVIEGLEINGSGKGDCIYVGNVTGHFVVRACILESAGGLTGMYSRNAGILLWNTTNGRIENNTLRGNECGICLVRSHGNALSGNNCSGNECGIKLEGSDSNIISGNAVADSRRKAFSASEDSLPDDSMVSTGIVPGRAEAGSIYPESFENAALIDDVPFYIWHHGCAPTAAGMIIGYWDSVGYGKLVAGDAGNPCPAAYDMIASHGNYYDYGLPMDDYTPEGPIPDLSEFPAGDEHSDDSVADFMNSSRSSSGLYYGWSWARCIDNSMQRYVEWAAPDYETVTRNLLFEELSWDLFTAEIDAGRPVEMCVDCDGDGHNDHGITAVGYAIEDGVRLYALHNTWDSNVWWYEFGPVQGGRPWGIYSATFLNVKISGWGMHISESDGNAFFGNRFTGNTRQAYDDGNNSWDAGYPAGGNYWSDHLTDDVFSGDEQQQLGSDGLCDLPYSGFFAAARAYNEVRSEEVYGPASGTEAGPFSLSHGGLRNCSVSIYNVINETWRMPTEGDQYYMAHGSGVLSFAQPLSVGDTVYASYNYTAVASRKAVDRYPLADTAQPKSFGVPVSQGWNLISCPLEANGAPDSVLDDNGGDTEWTVLKWYDAGDSIRPWKSWRAGSAVNDMTNLTNTMALWIYITDPGSDGILWFDGMLPGYSVKMLNAGWNLVGYPTVNGNKTVSYAFWGTGADRVEAFDSASPHLISAVGPGYVMKPGEGYWVHVPADTAWTVNW